MQISCVKHEARVPVTMIQLSGKLDAANYTEVIDQAYDLYQEGVRDLLIDLSKVPYVSSAGLMSLHTVVLIFSGQSVLSKDGKRPIFRPINMARDGEVRKHVKIFNPQASVLQVLDVVGLSQFFEIYSDLPKALEAF